MYWSLQLECEWQNSIVRKEGACKPKILNDAPWFSSITFELDSSPSLSEFHSKIHPITNSLMLRMQKQLVERQKCLRRRAGRRFLL